MIKKQADFKQDPGPMLEIEKVAGSSNESAACSVFSKKIEDSSGRVGTLVAVVYLKNTGGGDLQSSLRDIFEIVTKKFEGSETSTLEAIRLSVKAGIDYLASREIEVNLAVVFFLGEACYIGRYGANVHVLVFDKERSEEIDFEFGSGPVFPEQTYLIATEFFLKIFDKSALLGEENLAETRDGLATELSSREDQGAIAAAFVRINEGSELVEEEANEAIESHENREKMEEFTDQDSGLGEDEVGEDLREQNAFSRVFGKIKAIRFGSVRSFFKLRRSIVIVACTILVILGISIGFSVKSNIERERRGEFQAHMSQALTKYNEGAAIVELNKQKAREILITADKEVKIALDLNSNSEDAKKLASDISSKLKETEATSGIEFKIVAESDEPLNSLAFNDGKIVGFSKGKLVEIDLKSHQKSEIALKSDVSSGFIFDGKAFLLSDEGVRSVNLASEKEEKLVDFDEAVEIAVFLGNIYLLSSTQIQKFVPVEGGFSDAVDYLDSKRDFGQRGRFAIDGSIWVTSGRKIYKFTRGIDDNFEISGLPEMGEFGPIYTNSDIDNLYVVDVSNSALLVIGKDGIWRKAYQSGEFSRLTDLVVDEVNKKVYISSANRILEAGLE